MPYAKVSISKSLDVSPDDIDVYFVETWEPASRKVNNYPLVSLEKFLNLNGALYFNIAIGDGKARADIATKIGKRAMPLAIHAPQTLILDQNQIGAGSILCPNSMVTSNASIGQFFHANIYSYVAHDCVIGDFVTFAPGVRCNGHVEIGDFAYVGTNAIIREGSRDRPIRIGECAVIGMGAVVTKDVPSGVTVVGNPARPLTR